MSRARERREHLEVLRRALLIRGVERPPRAVAVRVGHERLVVRRIRADADDAVGTGLVRRDVIGRETVELVRSLQRDVPRVIADVARVVLAEPGELGTERARPLALGRTERARRRAACRSARGRRTGGRPRRATTGVERTERVVERAALQLPLPEIDGLALKLLGELLHLGLGVHRDVDAALAREIAQLDWKIVERRDARSPW